MSSGRCCAAGWVCPAVDAVLQGGCVQWYIDAVLQGGCVQRLMLCCRVGVSCGIYIYRCCYVGWVF